MHKTHNPFCIVIVYDYGRKEIKRKNSSLLLRHISDKDPGTQIVKSGRWIIYSLRQFQVLMARRREEVSSLALLTLISLTDNSAAAKPTPRRSVTTQRL